MNDILIDAGPLIAIADESEGKAHVQCTLLFYKSNGNFITTLPCLTEAMYFLGQSQGWRGQEKIWKLVAGEAVVIHDLSDSDLYRMSILMEKYHDTPMDFADASIVVTAEKLNTKTIFTLDSDFSVYRINGRTSFEIIP